jgi:hypothetical protein
MLRPMTSDQPADVTLTNSVVSFDGRVLELFGHASRTGNRIHLALIANIESDGEKIVITTRGAIDYTILLSGEDEAKRAEVEALIETVRRAAPGLS